MFDTLDVYRPTVTAQEDRGKKKEDEGPKQGEGEVEDGEGGNE